MRLPCREGHVVWLDLGAPMCSRRCPVRNTALQASDASPRSTQRGQYPRPGVQPGDRQYGEGGCATCARGFVAWERGCSGTWSSMASRDRHTPRERGPLCLTLSRGSRSFFPSNGLDSRARGGWIYSVRSAGARFGVFIWGALTGRGRKEHFDASKDLEGFVVVGLVAGMALGGWALLGNSEAVADGGEQCVCGNCWGGFGICPANCCKLPCDPPCIPTSEPCPDPNGCDP